MWSAVFRVWHWAFGLSLCASVYFGMACDPESVPFQYHMVCGLFAAVTGCIRLLLGLRRAGPERWGAFFSALCRLPRHLASVFRPGVEAGVNPGTAWVALGMYGCLVLLVYSGFDLSWGEEWHGRFSDALLVLVGLHLAGLVVNAVASRGGVWASMLHGAKWLQAGDPGARAAEKARAGWGAAWALALVLGAVLVLLFRGLDPETATIRIPWLGEFNLPYVQRG